MYDETYGNVDESMDSPKIPERLRPSITSQADENQLISLAIDAAKKMMVEGKAPTSVILHYLKLATTREKLEQEMMGIKQELMLAQKQAIEAQARTEELYANALKAMQRYSGYSGPTGEDDIAPDDYRSDYYG